MNKDANLNLLVDEMSRHLAALEHHDALVAAAHLDAAIEALCRQFDLERIPSKVV